MQECWINEKNVPYEHKQEKKNKKLNHVPLFFNFHFFNQKIASSRSSYLSQFFGYDIIIISEIILYYNCIPYISRIFQTTFLCPYPKGSKPQVYELLRTILKRHLSLFILLTCSITHNSLPIFQRYSIPQEFLNIENVFQQRVNLLVKSKKQLCLSFFFFLRMYVGMYIFVLAT